jgi:hypothetical protein
MQDVEALLRQMTLQEKVAMLAGTNDWYTVPVERLGIPSLKVWLPTRMWLLSVWVLAGIGRAKASIGLI